MSKPLPPTQESVTAALDTGKESIEGITYARDKIFAIFDAAKLGLEVAPLKQTINEVVQAITYQLSSNSGSWSGQQVEASPIKNMHANIANAMATLLNNKQEQQQKMDVRLDYAISEQGQFIRGYESVEPELVAEESRGYDAKTGA